MLIKTVQFSYENLHLKLPKLDSSYKKCVHATNYYSRVQVIRQPSGPDGSKGFKIKRDTDTLTELHEEEDNNPDMEGVE